MAGFNLKRVVEKGRIPRVLDRIQNINIPRARWRGPLNKINERILIPITTEEIAVAPEVRTHALKIQMKINRQLIKLPAEKPELEKKIKPPTGPEKSSEKTEEFDLSQFAYSDDNAIWGGSEGVIVGEKIGIPELAGLCRKGARPNNEDAIIASHKEGLTLLGVKDGAGGMQAGEVASAVAASTTLGKFQKDPAAFELAVALDAAHEAVRAQKIDGGTTTVAILIKKDRAEVANIGDSPAVRIRFKDGKADINLLTLEDSANHDFYAEKRKKNGKDPNLSVPLSHEETRAYWNGVRELGSHYIRKALGKEPTQKELEKGILPPFPLVTKKIRLKKGDLLLLCSDGLAGFISFEVLENTVNEYRDKPLTELSRALYNAAREEMLVATRERIEEIIKYFKDNIDPTVAQELIKALEDGSMERYYQIIAEHEKEFMELKDGEGTALYAFLMDVVGDNITLLIHKHARSAPEKAKLAEGLSAAFKLDLPQAQALAKEAHKNAAIQALLEEAVEELLEERRKTDALNGEIAQLKGELKSSEEARGHLRTSLETQSQRVEQLTAAQASASTLVAMTRKAQERYEQFNAAANEVLAAAKKLEMLKTEAKEADQLISETAAELNDLRALFDKTEKDLAAGLDRKIAEAQQDYQEFSRAFGSPEDVAAALKDSLVLGPKKERLEKKIAELTAQKESLALNNDELKDTFEKIEEATSTLADLKKYRKALGDEHKEIVASYSPKKEELKAWREEMKKIADGLRAEAEKTSQHATEAENLAQAILARLEG